MIAIVMIVIAMIGFSVLGFLLVRDSYAELRALKGLPPKKKGKARQ